MQRTADELAAYLNGTVEGDGQVTVRRVGRIESAECGDLTFLANPDYEGYIYGTEASVAIVSVDFLPKRTLPAALTLVRVSDPYAAFGRILELADTTTGRPPGIHATAVIDPSAEIGADCAIGPYVVIEAGARIGAGADLRAHVYIGLNALVGARTLLHAGVRVGDRCEIGDACILQANAVIGSDGFGFAPQADGAYRKVPQTGNVLVGEGCEIGACTTIDRATIGSTIIGRGVKLDNHIQVGHNVSIGDHTVIAAQTGIAGSTSIGARCMIGGQVGIAGHLRIADGVRIGAQSGIGASLLKPDTDHRGTPSLPMDKYLASQLGLRALLRENILGRIAALEHLVPHAHRNDTP